MAVRPRKPVPPHSKQPGAFHEFDIAPFFGIEAAFDEHGIGIPHGPLAVLAVEADQALRENAVQRGDEVIGLDADVQEAAEHVDHVIGVDRGEDQVAGERRVDGDLRGFLIADFADHDLIGIVTQDGAQAAREGQALFLVDRNLGDAFELVFDRVFDGDDLVFVVLDFAQRGVEGGGFAGTGGSGDQHHAVGLGDVAAEFRQIAGAEAHDVETTVWRTSRSSILYRARGARRLRRGWSA